ncbi:DNA-3-methyladenine glycosylase I [Aggregicoccus sp. 17bor-14]|uniref:DNA-3-methyladenine glycosylase I n=1 Tax=Myxococcaceae TaxID=31 RepID=UPI00129C9E47|nr:MULTISPECIES: DNA-3-methyladenine glycosylase I [Myxococcaceae]MBF5046045.1 DNA-3-methyladenine glycosylase I [Simulacricoccus sp. 17bor-14]MRI91775.1 DNA-3-methyladenine glycosylase I [Aggregicoccus sp. 17bor-14]
MPHTAGTPPEASEAAEPRRCPWAGSAPDYRQYHDEEWGRPRLEDTELLERLSLEAFQSGLSWLTILRKREAFRKAFHGFEPERVARFGPRDVERLLGDAGIVRNRQKIEAAVTNARATLALQRGGGSLAQLIWSFAPARRPAPRSPADVPASTPESRALAQTLKREGFCFVGPTTAYALFQAVGVVNDHLADCHVRAACARDQAAARAKLNLKG